MSLLLPFKVGDVVSNDVLSKAFSISTQGGMRYSRTNNALVLICDNTKALYKDAWENGIMNYTGMGQKGDQTLSYQNKTLAESRTNGVEVHLFEVNKPKQYSYSGVVRLAGEPFTEEQPDVEGKKRKVWVFPLEKDSEKKDDQGSESTDDYMIIKSNKKEDSITEGSRVRHDYYGDGEVIKIGNGMISVSFHLGTRIFDYPEAIIKRWLIASVVMTPRKSENNDEETREIILDASKGISYKTILDALNDTVGTDYSGWRKAVWPQEMGNGSFRIWFPQLAETRNGEASPAAFDCVNTLSDDWNTLTYVDLKVKSPEDEVEHYKGYDLIFAKDPKGGSYVFRGVYVRDEENSSMGKNVSKRIGTKVRLLGKPANRLEVLEMKNVNHIDGNQADEENLSEKPEVKKGFCIRCGKEIEFSQNLQDPYPYCYSCYRKWADEGRNENQKETYCHYCGKKAYGISFRKPVEWECYKTL